MMNKPSDYITLSEALSWLAFGIMHDRIALNAELAADRSYGFSDADSKKRLSDALTVLANQAHSGNILLEGKRLLSPEDDVTKAQNEKIPQSVMVDFRAFDITIDGLRFGNGLLWLPDSTAAWEYTETKRPEYYQNILVKFTDLKKHAKSGQSPVFTATDKPNLPLGTLNKWWGSLSQAEKKSSENKVISLCKKTYPENRIIRQRIRDLRGSQKRGPKPISP